MNELGSTERRLVALCQAINERPLAKRVQREFLDRLGRHWVRACTSNRQDVRGLDNALALEPERGVLICANHRSFFDLYVISSVLLCARVPWYREHYFPVRNTFFYERWAGLGVNLLMSGGAMYPPIFREFEKTEINKISVARIVEFLQRPGVAVGMHPEGTRGKGPDRYELLRAQPGVGQIALQARVPVLPIWIQGLGNDLPQQIASNFGPPERRGEPIVINIGAPVDLDDLRAKTARVTLYKRAADRILDAIRDLGHEVRDAAS